MAIFGLMTALPVATSGILAGRLSILRQPVWRAGAAVLSLGLALYIGWQAIAPGGHGSHMQTDHNAVEMPEGAHHHHH